MGRLKRPLGALAALITPALLTTLAPISAAGQTVPPSTEAIVLKHEDTRAWDASMARLIRSRDWQVRRRLALAAGRIESPVTTPLLVRLLDHDPSPQVQAAAAFALGQIADGGTVSPLAFAIAARRPLEVRGRCIEALGRIVQAAPKNDPLLRGAVEIIETALLTPHSDAQFLRLCITAVMRAKAPDAASSLAPLLGDTRPEVRADAAEAMARVGSIPATALPILRRILERDPDPLCRANAAHALGAAKDRVALAALSLTMANDPDERVRASAARALGSLRERDSEPAIERRIGALESGSDAAANRAELLELCTALGQAAQNTGDTIAFDTLRSCDTRTSRANPEISVAMARIDPAQFVAYLTTQERDPTQNPRATNAEAQDPALALRLFQSAAAQGLAAAADQHTLPDTARRDALAWLSRTIQAQGRGGIDKTAPTSKSAAEARKSLPDILAAYAAFKPAGLDSMLATYLTDPDVYVRAQAVSLIGAEPATSQRIAILKSALARELNRNPNDAAVAAIDGLAALHTKAADAAMMAAFSSRQYLVRREAAVDLKANGVGDDFDRVGPAEPRNTHDDIIRAAGREGTPLYARVRTEKGAFTLRLLTDEAPLTVDNFVDLARRGFFDGLTFHRVVSDFVIQGGDPHGDGQGGPGYQIRDEINTAPYDTGAVGMALAGRDTGGSQWFVTHSPQPRLDGNYTVFAQVVSGMDTVERIQRGDRILGIEFSSTPSWQRPISPVSTTRP